MHYSEISLNCMAKAKSRPETMGMMKSKENCKAGGCASLAVVSLAGRDLCLDHFFASCYERLDMLEPMARSRALDSTQLPAIRGLLDECSNRTLLVCLRHESLTNLDRSRLLEILLLCGDLQMLISKSPSFLSTPSSPRAPLDSRANDAQHRKNEETQSKKRSAD